MNNSRYYYGFTDYAVDRVVPKIADVVWFVFAMPINSHIINCRIVGTACVGALHIISVYLIKFQEMNNLLKIVQMAY